MNPGATTRSVASMVRVAVIASRVTAVMRSPSMPTLAMSSKPVSGSMTRPPVMAVAKT